ncbi:hypothetical protein ACQ4PT_010195 [Festuca glaucescens]
MSCGASQTRSSAWVSARSVHIPASSPWAATTSSQNDCSSHQGNGLTLVYVTETAALGIENSVPPELRGQYQAVAAGDNLYTLDSQNINNGDLPYLCQTVPDHIPRSIFDTDEKEDMPYCRRPQRRWAWERLPALPPFTSGNPLVENRPNTRIDSGEWTRRGDWCLPFSGHAHYDGDLGAWVGTRTVYSKEDGCGYDYLCTCDVPDISKDSVARMPAWSVAKEKLTFLEAPLKTLGHVLLPIGGDSGVFCLVEPTVRQGFTTGMAVYAEGRSSSKPRHVRSVSLPACTTSSHPLLANLNAHIAAVRSLTHTSLTASLTQIHGLNSALADLLLLQDPQGALHRATNVGDRLLDSFLLLADAHQGFQGALLDLKHAAVESSAALRRGDAARAASATRSQRRAEKELTRLAASISAVSSKCARLNLAGTEDAEMAGALMEAAAASGAASAAVFSAAASMSSSSPVTSSSCKKDRICVWFLWQQGHAGDNRAGAGEAASARGVLQRLRQRLRQGVQEHCADKGLLLNIMTPTI